MKRRLWIGLLGALVATGIWWLRIQDKTSMPTVRAAGAAPFVQVTGAGLGGSDQIVRERSEYFDPTPLFFPTKWNYGQMPLRATMRRGPGQVFSSYEPKWTVGDESIKAYTAVLVPVPDGLADVLGSGNQAPFGGIGQEDRPRQRLAERSAFLEVRALGGKKSAINQALMGLSVVRSDFGPLEYLATIGPFGLIGDLVMVNGSGSEEVDGFFRDYLVTIYRLGERLPPGQYQVQVGP